MRKSTLSLKRLYHLVKHFLERVELNQQQSKSRGRLRKYSDDIIITLLLYQTLNGYSYRETLEKAKQEGFNGPVLSDYHYRVKRLNEELLKLILGEWTKFLLHKKEDKIQFYIADATGFAFGEKYNLKWHRGMEIKSVSSHVRLGMVAAVIENGKRIIVVKFRC